MKLGSHFTTTSLVDTNRPLALLPPPGRAGHRNGLDDSFSYTYELARKMYSIRDAFRCIVQVGSNLTPSVKGIWCRERELPNLTVLSAAVIGKNLESQFRGITDERASMDEELTDPVAEIYECIPSHLLRSVATAHAIDLILRICPHHPTLLYLILEVCLTQNLGTECDTILQALLAVAVSTGSSVPPLCHPAHGTYLVDLCTVWTTAGRNKRHFFAILTNTLMRYGAQDSWTSKALQNLINQACSHDVVPVFEIASGLVRVFQALMKQPSLKRRKCTTENWDDPSRAAIENRLVDWIGAACNSFDTPSETSPEDDAERWSIALQFIKETQAVGLLEKPGFKICDDSNFLYTVVRLATVCLAQAIGALPHDVEELVDILRQTTPTTRMYDSLIASALDRISRLPSRFQVQDLRNILHLHAHSLRAHHLFRLEASLWACALRHVEDLDGESTGFLHANHRQLENFREDLMDWVEEAERRCVGFDRLGLRRRSSLQSDNSNEANSEGEWMWEEVVGCWLRKTRLPPTVTGVEPVRSRQQPSPTSSTPTPSLSSSDEFFVPDDESKSISSYSSPSSPTVIRTLPTISLSPETEIETENEPLCPSSPLAPLVAKHPQSRRKSTFQSILADSLRNRIVLDTNCPTSVFAPHTPILKPMRRSVDKACLSSPGWNISSDDALDLFNHMPSPSQLVS